MTELIQKVKELIHDSDKILIGIGEEFSSNEVSLLDSSIYTHYLEKSKNEECSDEVAWLEEYIRNHYINNEIQLERLNVFLAYKKLFEIVKDKDYYIVNLNFDSLLEKAGFSADRIVYPCGNKGNFQCSNNCSNVIWSSSDIEDNIMKQILDNNKKLCEIKKPICEKCGEIAQYNVIGKQNYSESGYLEKWSDYMEWISHTLNKKISVLELGVDFKYPTVIRWPFEKIAFFNNKAFFIRINEKFEQVNEELSQKSLTIKKNSISFFLNNN